jgi:spore coat polysaccharide biosynthesis protein SpsF (cytidylyltransferase family)
MTALAPGHLRRRGLRLTVDTEEDLAFVQRLLEAVGPHAFPAPLSTVLDIVDRLVGSVSGRGADRVEMR